MSLTTLIELSFVLLMFPAFILYHYSQKFQPPNTSTNQTGSNFRKFQNVYFLPYFLALFSDWLQGPYVYKLYSYYGYSELDISLLYIVGFGASVVFGTVTGPLADKFGRKKVCIAFCFLYSACCLTKVYNNFVMLLLGRIMGGTATSVLFSVFETWYIHQHTVKYQYPTSLLSATFSKATFFNGMIAILAGIIAELAVDGMGWGPVSPFIIAVPSLFLSCLLIAKNWEENYGIAQSIFESNMYIFVFLWTPVLEPGKPALGIVFSCFMVSIMIGSSLYACLLNQNFSSSSIFTYCLVTMGTIMAVCTMCSNPDIDKETVEVKFLAFLILEISIGMYFPCIGRLKGEAIPENLRANIMNWFRVPTNILTCSILFSMNYMNLSNKIVFLYCTLSSVVGAIVSYYRLEHNWKSEQNLLPK